MTAHHWSLAGHPPTTDDYRRKWAAMPHDEKVRNRHGIYWHIGLWSDYVEEQTKNMSLWQKMLWEQEALKK